MLYIPVKKVATKKAIVKKVAPAKAAAKAAPVKATKKAAPKKPAQKAVTKKAAPVKAVKKAAAKTPKPAKPVKETAAQKTARERLEAEAKDKGLSVEQLITERDMNLKSAEEYLGIKTVDYSKKPIIPGVFDLIIPPGTPRKLIIDMAKKYDLTLVRRDDIYVPIGVCDIQRDLLAIRGDEKTVKKMEKILIKEIKAFAN